MSQTRNAAELAATAAAAGSGMPSTEQKSNNPDSDSKAPQGGATFLGGQRKIQMTSFLGAFFAEFISHTTGVIEPEFNPLATYGLLTAHENVIKKILTWFGRDKRTFGLEDNPKIEAALKQNKYRIRIDSFLKRYYPTSVTKHTINSSPEFILLTLRTLLLKTEYHLERDPGKKLKHLTAVKNICLSMLSHGSEWANDTSFFTKITKKNRHYQDFCNLLVGLISSIKIDIVDCQKSLEDNTLPDSLRILKKTQDTLHYSCVLTFLQYLLAKPVPEDLFYDVAMIDFFDSESATFHEFQKSSVHNEFKTFIDNINIFNLVKNLYGAKRKKLRHKLIKLATDEVLAQAKRISGRMAISSATDAKLLDLEEKKKKKK